jgi:hypothetical protein
MRNRIHFPVRMEQSVSKRRLLNTIRRRTTQKIIHDIQKTTQAWNQELLYLVDVRVNNTSLTPVAARSKAWLCGLSPAEIENLNPGGGMDVCLL